MKGLGSKKRLLASGMAIVLFGSVAAPPPAQAIWWFIPMALAGLGKVTIGVGVLKGLAIGGIISMKGASAAVIITKVAAAKLIATGVGATIAADAFFQAGLGLGYAPPQSPSAVAALQAQAEAAQKTGAEVQFRYCEDSAGNKELAPPDWAFCPTTGKSPVVGESLILKP